MNGVLVFTSVCSVSQLHICRLLPMSFSPLLIITIVFSLLYFILVMYFLVGWLRLKKSSIIEHHTSESLPFVSIVIPTRNESQNIKACLESIFKQTYPQDLFEVVMVDDYSTDPTLQLAKEFRQNNLLVLDLMQYLGNPGEYVPNKKKALALGIKNAKGDLIITTDGDCVAGENWLRSMVSYYQQNDFKLLTGPVLMKPAYFPLQIFQQLDVMNLIGITGATISHNFPIMCNGANLMYAKQTFHEVEGFKGNHDIPTGDDIFLMQKIHQRYPNGIGFVKNFDACVFTKPEKGIGRFVSQRIRWISKSTGFNDFKVTAVLYFAYFFNLMIIVSLCYTFPLSELSWLPFAVMAGTKLIADFLFDIPVTIFFRKWYMLLLLPFTEGFHILYVVIIGPLSLIGRYRWKDRLVK